MGSMLKLIQTIKECRKRARHELNIQNVILFTCINNNQLKYTMEEQVAFTITTKINYLGINLAVVKPAQGII